MYDILRTINTAKNLARHAKAAPQKVKDTKKAFVEGDKKKRFWMIAAAVGLVAVVVWVFSRKMSESADRMDNHMSIDEYIQRWGR